MAAKEKWQLFKLEKLLFMAFGSLDQCSTSAMSFIPLKGILRSKTSLFCSLEGSLVFENDLLLVKSIFFHFSALDLKYFCWCDSSNDQFPYRVARVLMDVYTQSGPVFLLHRPYTLYVHDHRCHLSFDGRTFVPFMKDICERIEDWTTVARLVFRTHSRWYKDHMKVPHMDQMRQDRSNWPALNSRSYATSSLQ